MSTYYGIKPIVGDGLVGFIHGMNINAFSGSDYISNVIGTQSLKFNITNSVYNPIKNQFSLDGTTQYLVGDPDDLLNYYGGGNKSMTFWFRPNDVENFIFDKGYLFNLYLTKEHNLTTHFKGNQFRLIYGMDVLGQYLYVNTGGSNNHNGFLVVDKDTLKIKDYKFDRSQTQTFRAAYPLGLAVDIYTASIYVAELYQVYKFDTYPAWITDIGDIWKTWTYSAADDPVNNASWIYGIDVDDEFIYTARRSSHYVVKTKKSDQSYVTASRQVNCYGVCIDQFDSESVYWNSDSTDKIFKARKTDFNILLETGSTGTGNSQFQLPWDMETDETCLFVCDYSNNKLKKFLKSDLTFTQSVAITLPTSVCISGSDLYVASKYGKIYKYNKDTLEEIKSNQVTIEYYGSNASYAPKPLAFFSPNNIFSVSRGRQFKWYKRTDCGNFNYKGQYVIPTTWANDAYGMAISGSPDWTGGLEAHAYIAQSPIHIVTKYSMSMSPGITLTYVTHSGIKSAASGTDIQWSSPRDLEYDDDYLYVCDFTNDRIKKLNKSDLTVVAITGSFNGPIGITISGSHLYIASYYQAKIAQIDKEFNHIADHTGITAPYQIRYDEFTNQFYIKYGSGGRNMQLRDKDFNLIKSKAYMAGQESAINGIGISYYGLAVDNEYVYVNDSMTILKAFGKDSISYEREITPARYTTRMPIRSSLVTGSFCEVTIVFEPDNYKLYFNGNYITSESIYDPGAAYEPWKMVHYDGMKLGKGGVHYNWTPFYSQTDFGALMVYNKELTGGEIKQNYDALKWEFKR